MCGGKECVATSYLFCYCCEGKTSLKSIKKMSVFKVLSGICKYVSRDSDSVGLDKFRPLCFKQSPG